MANKKFSDFASNADIDVVVGLKSGTNSRITKAALKTTLGIDAIEGDITTIEGQQTTQDAAIALNTSKRTYPLVDEQKLATIASGAEVNVNADWNAVSGDAQILNKPTIPTVAGSNTQIQFNNAGAFGASANLIWDNVNNRLGLGVEPTQALQVHGAVYISSFFRTDSTAMFRDNRGNGIITQSVNTLITNRNLTIGNGTYSNIVMSTTKLGVNVTPTATLHAKGIGTTTGLSFKTENSSSVETFVIKDNGIINAPLLPTSSAGLSAGDIWNDAGTLKIV